MKKEYHVHLCNMGTNVDPSIAMTRGSIPIDKVYLLCSKNIENSVRPEIYRALITAEQETIRILNGNDIKDVEVKKIESWDFQSVIDEILDIASTEKRDDLDVRFHINFTSGTHVMAGAACCAAFYIGADLYYVMNKDEHEGLTAMDEMRVFSIPSMPDVSSIKGISKDVLLKINDNGSMMNSELLGCANEQANVLGYHTGVLKRMGLIEDERKGNKVRWKCTYAGNIACKLIRRPVSR